MSLKSATKVDTNRVELEVEVDAEAFEAAVSNAFKRSIGKMSVPGFRKGKAPRHLVEKLYGEGVFYDDAVNDLYPTALNDAIEQSDFEYIEDKVDLDVVSVGKEGLVFKAVITVKPEVEVGEYKGLKAEKKTVSVTQEDIDAEISTLQDRNSRLVTVEGRAAQNEDTVTFDFEGFVDGNPFEGGKAENFSLELGSGRFIPGFEEQIVGKSTDEEFEVNVTFPEDYQADELKRKPAVFKCKLHEIKAKEMPELNDDFAKDVSEFDTLDQLKADLKGKLEHQREHAAEDEFESTLLEQLVEGLKGEIPEAMFERRVDDSVAEFEQRLKSQGLNVESYLGYTGMDAETFRNGFRQQAEKQVKIRLALEKIASVENITISNEELEAEYAKFAEQYKMDVDKIKSFISSKELVKDLEVGKALDLVKESAEIS
ncbi:MAG: trigger factor [Oscillospiraceae bacterium]|nr:trigger factor [Oscillospiraceae bacterium]MDD4545853.1 trigger factor [Oscillospiraceae bacterium]